MQFRLESRSRSTDARHLVTARLALETLEDRLPPGSLSLGGMPAGLGMDLAAAEVSSWTPASSNTASISLVNASSSDATPAARINSSTAPTNAPAAAPAARVDGNTTVEQRSDVSNLSGLTDQNQSEASLSAVAARRVLLGLGGSEGATTSSQGGALTTAPDSGAARLGIGAAPAANSNSQSLQLAQATLVGSQLGQLTAVHPISSNPDGSPYIVYPTVRGNNRDSCAGGNRIQSETSVAVSGDAVVMTYNDFRGFYCAGNGYQVTGWAYSLDDGQTFTDGHQLPGGTNLGGDGQLATGPDGTIYMASLWRPLSAMAVLRGTVTDMGISWSNPTIIQQSGEAYDKEDIAIDQNTGTIYLTYTGFGVPGIRMVTSTDGGLTFGPAVAVANVGGLQGSAPTVGPNGEVYVAYNIGYPSDTGIGFVMSTDGGQTFTAPRQIQATTRFAISGTDRAPSFPRIAVDETGGPYTGNIYVVWQSAISGRGEAVLTKSTDGGATWSDPAVINNDGGTGIEWQPTVSVDFNGNVNTFFYSRRGLSGNMTNLYYDQSSDGGDSFNGAVQVNENPYVMNPSGDGSPAWGDYMNSASVSFDGVNADAIIAYADGRDGDPDAYFGRVTTLS